MSEEKYSGDNRREHFRIIYPITCRPKFRIIRKEYEVIDISESGIKFLYRKDPCFTEGAAIRGELTFNAGDSLNIEGMVLRIDKEIIILKLNKKIPFWKIIDEQRYVKENYPEYRLP